MVTFIHKLTIFCINLFMSRHLHFVICVVDLDLSGSVCSDTLYGI